MTAPAPAPLPPNVPDGPGGVPVVREDSILELHPLAVRDEDEEIVVGRTDTGDFIALPPVGARALGLLAEGHTPAQTRRLLRAQTGQNLDITGLATDLVPLGFVATCDGQPVPGPAPLRPTWPRLSPAAVAWTLHPALPVLLTTLVAVAVFVTVGRPQLWPGYRQLIWSEHTGLVLLVQAAIAWSLLGIHELAHLITARAAGVPGRITFGTRLQFLVAQTEVPGIWAAPRRHRLTIYAAGMATDVALASTAVLTAANTDAGTVVHRVALIVTTTVTITLTIQLMAFMRTDIYFLIQDLTGCRTLYAHAAAHARHQARRVAAKLRRKPAPGTGPLATLPIREARIVRVYTLVLIAGTAMCLTAAAAVTIPFDLHLLTAAAGHLLDPSAPVAVRALDGGVVLLVLLAPQALWARAWWRRHGHHLINRRRARAA
ncbi:hypothetical protein OIE69_44490 (plasmid) [Actinacidiphila glaucinigra]|uniref:hypothetical protein n=1 Tax=Actinacidiphila glaucinigra TaxID=235986 RepID=UPI002DDA76A0|nr:hypothetical protein [Actinacidiphila glaucinigra]WSD65748.1 hypothetical protein OIE69_43360 [Actinacidiphila glaucinigra]WSD65964.1 hypothetical protein OIE69_44490 [Actinacidiphila glaucinigra]